MPDTPTPVPAPPAVTPDIVLPPDVPAKPGKDAGTRTLVIGLTIGKVVIAVLIALLIAGVVLAIIGKLALRGKAPEKAAS